MLNMPADLYVTADAYLKEQRTIFTQAWQMLGPARQVEAPGSYLAVEVAGMKLFVLRGRDGVLRGFRNVCRHRGARLLAEGQGSCKMIRCPYHTWVYGEDGTLRSAPWFGKEGEIDLSQWSLEPISVKVWRGLLFTAFNPAETLESQLGRTIPELGDVAMEDYHPVREERLVFDANWKIYTDNFVEGYHIPGIHPAFYEAIRFEAFETTGHDGLVRMTAPPKEGLFYKGRWYWMWANWTLSLFSGGMNTSRINPLGPDRTELIYHFYFEDTSPETEAAREDTIQRNLAVVREDFEICLETHRNYQSGAYTPGPLSPHHEQGVAYFQQKVLASLGG